MNLRIHLLMLIGLFLLAACAGQNQDTPPPEMTATLQEALAVPTFTTSPPTETEQPQPSATPLEQIQTQVEPTSTATAPATLEPTAITCDGVLTPPQQEGPFFSPGSPQRDSLVEEGMPGVPVQIIGRVFDQDCNPISGAKLDFWLADVDGQYDNVGYTLRGHIFTDENGYYTLESIEPTSYTGRPPHIHVKVYAPSGEELLTTQMYFAGSEDSAEVINNPGLYVTYLEADVDGRLQVLFSFMVNAGQ